MKERDLAARRSNAVESVVTQGAAERKKEMEKTLPEELYHLHRTRRFHIHDMEYFDVTYNCLGVLVSDFVPSGSSFPRAVRSLFRGIIELTNQHTVSVPLKLC